MQHIIFVGENLNESTAEHLLSHFENAEVLPQIDFEKLDTLTSSDSGIIFIDCNQLTNPSSIKQQVDKLRNEKNAILLRPNSDCFSLVPSPEILKTEIEANSKNPIAGIVCEPAMLLVVFKLFEDTNIQPSLASLFLGLAVLGLTHDFPVEMLPIIRTDRSESADLTNSDRAFLLKCLTQLFNIEEIFPSNDWENAPQISAATSYQELATQFLLLGDTAAALECLNISDQFTETARSYALRGVVASQKGDSLAAVANIVSSLQQYEESVPNEGLQEQIEMSVTNCLQSGLDALNTKNNRLAFEKFAEAIANYDPYFRDRGLMELFAPSDD